MRGIIPAILLTAFLLPFSVAASYEDMEQLDQAATFSFAIMSDNKGDSPYSSEEFANMVDSINRSSDAFVIGLGDHVKRGWSNDFLQFLDDDEWWHRWFYPNVADGENEYYGQGQGDWGAGAPILDEVDMDTRPGVEIRDNGAEYYARIEVKGYTIHLIQLTFSDTPSDPDTAFTESSRNYLIETLNGIDKGQKDMVIVGAHSIGGSWLEVLSEERIEAVMDKTDLLLSATTHYFTRIIPRGYSYSGALCINTGSITYPSGGSEPGYVQVHVLEDPLRLVTHYHDARQEERVIRCGRYSFVKEIDGIILEDICSYDPDIPACWPEDPATSPPEVVQGEIFTVTCRAKYRSVPVKPNVTLDLYKVEGDKLPMYDDGSPGDGIAGDGVYSLTTRMPSDARLGEHHLDLIMEYGEENTDTEVEVTVLPAGDYLIFSDRMRPGWIKEEMGGANLTLSADDPNKGSVCQHLSLDRGGGARYSYIVEEGFPTSGFDTLEFLIRPVEMTPESIFIQLSSEGAPGTVTLSDLGLDFPEGSWTPVRVPLESLGMNGTYLSSIRISSTVPTDLYLDDLKMSVEMDQKILYLLIIWLGFCCFERAEPAKTATS